jgi:hypothetical protein
MNFKSIIYDFEITLLYLHRVEQIILMIIKNKNYKCERKFKNLIKIR